MRSLVSVLASAVILLGAASSAWAQRVQLDISGANFKPLPLALPEVRTGADKDKAAAKEVDETLQNDLQVSGIFELLDRKGFLDANKEGMVASAINFQHWLDVAAEALVKGVVSSEGKELRGEFRLFTVAAGKEELKLNLTVADGDARKLAHQVADALFKFYTHEPGPFQTKVVYVKKNGQNKDVCIADWDGHHERQLTKGGLNLLPGWSPDGTKVAFTSYKSGNPDLYVFDLNTNEMTPVVRKGTLVTGAAFSPNGKQLAFSMSEGEGSQIWVVNADGSAPRRITNDAYGINSSPAWSPDGNRLVFVSNRAGSPQLYIVPASGGGATRLTFQGNYNQTPDWSPRGDLIAFTARDERNVFDLFTISLDGAKVTRLTQDQGNNEEPTFAPNGRLIAFTSSRAGVGKSDLYVMGTDGNHQIQLTHGEDVSTPAWGPLVGK
jgi:TolB protein